MRQDSGSAVVRKSLYVNDYINFPIAQHLCDFAIAHLSNVDEAIERPLESLAHFIVRIGTKGYRDDLKLLLVMGFKQLRH